jgi:hypothetical protein
MDAGRAKGAKIGGTTFDLDEVRTIVGHRPEALPLTTVRS